MKKSFKELDETIARCNHFLESGIDRTTAKNIHAIRTKAAIEKCELCNKELERAKALYESGALLDVNYDEIYKAFNEAKEEAELYNMPYTESVLALGLSMALTELAAYKSAIIKAIPVSAIGEVISLPVKKFINARLSRYPVLFPDCVAFKQLTSERYSINEVAQKFNIKLEYSDSWVKGNKDVNAKVYFYNEKPVMIIGYVKEHRNFVARSNIETRFIDSTFKKHDDYYTACMVTSVQLSHPAVMRVLKRMEKLWKSQVDREKKAIKECGDEVESFGYNRDKVLDYITEGVESGYVDEYDAEIFRRCASKWLNE